MTAFEFVCYAAAILTVLWLRAEPQAHTPIAVAPVPVDDLPTLPELLAEAEVLTARPVPAVAAAVAAPIAIARVEVEPATNWAKMTSQELRKECSRRGIAWRGVREGKHLTKPQMVKALGA